MTLFDILSHNGRVIVFSDEGDMLLYTWNQSLTFQVWQKRPFRQSSLGESLDLDAWDEVDIRTKSDKPASFEEARILAQEWHHGD